jgi:HflK protein
MATLFRETIIILNEMAVYLLVGFLLSGVLHALLRRRRGILAPLEGPGPKPVFLAALLGIPLSLCSCSVLPTGVQLMRRGVRKGAAASFLITVPETDIVAIFLTYGLTGAVMAIFRPVAALITGISAGLVINLLDRRRPPGIPSPDPGPVELPVDGCGDACCADDCGAPSAPAALPRDAAPAPVPEFEPCGDDCGCAAPPPRPRGFFAEALHYGFVEFFDDLLLRLLLGIVIGAAITVIFPATFLARFAANPVAAYAAMLALGIPLYVCASASIPIAAGLIAAGFSPGAALVFLLAGPATNVASILVLVKEFGRVVFAIYLAMIAVVAVAMGILLDFLVRRGLVAPPDFSKLTAGGDSGWSWVGGIVFLLLAAWSFWRRRLDLRFLRGLERRAGIRLSPRTLGRIVIAVALAWWLLSGFFAVKPGERAAVTRFGAITSANLGPGLHYSWPRPFGQAHRAAVGQIRRVEIGFRSDGTAAAPGFTPGPQDEGTVKPGQPAVHGAPTESWMLTGDENIVDVQAVAQYQLQDTPGAVRAYLFGVEDPARLVRSAATWALQEAVGGRSIDSLLTADRSVVERYVRDTLMQPALDSWGSGIRVIDFRLVSVHAPTPVHWAFRDVAGAAEDAVTYVNQALEYRERVLLEAQGDSTRGILLSQGQAAERVQSAQGESASFLAQSDEYRRAPGLTRTRLYLEKLDAVLPGMNLYLDLTGSHTKGPAIWIKRGAGYDSVPFGGAGGGSSSGAGTGGAGGSGTNGGTPPPGGGD